MRGCAHGKSRQVSSRSAGASGPARFGAAGIVSVAAKIGCKAETLRLWLRRLERDTGKRPGLTSSERERLKELEREVRELKRANEILRKASAYFAQVSIFWQTLPIFVLLPTGYLGCL